MSTRALLTGIAALFLTTGTAHAEEYSTMEGVDDDGYRTIVECNGITLKNYHISDVELYRIELSLEHRRKWRSPTIVFNADKEVLIVGRKRCNYKY
jgi:hypothetical protein